MIIGGHIIEKEVLVSELLSFWFDYEIFMSGSEAVIGAWNTELIAGEVVGEGVFEFDSLLLVHFWW